MITPEEATARLNALDCTGAERALLDKLVAAQGGLVPKADISTGTSNTAEVLISRLRKKIAAAAIPVTITTLRAHGYHLVLKAGEA